MKDDDANPPKGGQRHASLRPQVQQMLQLQTDDARRAIAADMGPRLERSLNEAERRASEELARALAQDAVDLVRQELAISIRHCKALPRDIAMKIAHDIEAVSAPFLEVSEVFTESDLLQLVLTVAPGAQAAIARRRQLPDSVATSIVEIGGPRAVESLMENANIRLKETAYSTIMFRFEYGHPWVLDRMADRPLLPATVAARLIAKVSDAARQKLAQRYGIREALEPAVNQARTTALLHTVSDAPADALIDLAVDLHKRGELTPFLILRSLRDGHFTFAVASLARRAGITPQEAATLMEGGVFAARRLCFKANLPEALHKEFVALFQELARPAEKQGRPH